MTGRSPADDEHELSLTDAKQVAAVRSAVYHAGRSNGLGPVRAAAVAEAAAVHLLGQLRARGYAVRWASREARDAIESAQLSTEPPELEAALPV